MSAPVGSIFGAARGDGEAENLADGPAKPMRGFVRATGLDAAKHVQDFRRGYFGYWTRPMAGERARYHSSLLKVFSAFASRRFLSRSSAAMASNVLALAVAFAVLASILTMAGSWPLAERRLACPAPLVLREARPPGRRQRQAPFEGRRAYRRDASASRRQA